VGHVPDPLLLRKSSSAGNRTGSVDRNFDHYTAEAIRYYHIYIFKTKLWFFQSLIVRDKTSCFLVEYL
jgi:hypothetical protein